MKNIQNLTDKQLYHLCQEYGKNIKIWKRKFSALLPEVKKRKLYKKRGFYSIYEFAGKIGGFSRKTVDEILRTYQKVENKPLLKAEIEKQGWAKVRAVTSIAENKEEKDLVYMIKSMSKSTLEEAVRLLKNQDFSERNQNLFEESHHQNFPPGWNSTNLSFLSTIKNFTTISFKIDKKTEFKLRSFQKKLEIERKEKIPFNDVLKELLERVEEKTIVY